jgi:hypothetical protein
MEPDYLYMVTRKLGVLLTSAEIETIKVRVRIGTTEVSKWLQDIIALLQEGGLAGLEIGERDLVKGWLERHVGDYWKLVRDLPSRGCA